MSFLIRNLTAGDIEIDDLGLTVEVGVDLDLRSETPNSIAISENLNSEIAAARIVILDPADGSTQLSTQDSLRVLAKTNAAPFGVQTGGTLEQLEDVNAPTPSNGYVLTYNTANSKWEPAQSSGGGTAPDTCFPFYRADGTLDTITVSNGFFPFFLSDGSSAPILMGSCN